MTTKHIHLCLVSKQPSPNLVPIVDPAMPVDEVVLLHTESFKHQADWLQKALDIHQIKTRFEVLPSADDMQILRDYFIDLYEKLKAEQPNAKLMCNVTSGTKPMSLALYEMALMTQQDGTEAYYQNFDDTLSWFVPGDRPRVEIEDKIKIKTFLLAHGVEVVNQPQSKISPQWRPLIDEMIDGLSSFQKGISTLNYHAVLAEKQPNLTSPNPADQNNPHFDALVDRLISYGLASWQGQHIRFSDESARFFCAGGWLEEYVYHTIRKMMSKSKRIQDLNQGVQVLSMLDAKVKTVANELDVIVLVNNQLLVLECKTYKTDPPNVQNSLYKLDTLAKQMGGALGKGLLITLNPLRSNDYERAKLYGIEVIQGDRFDQLENALSRHIY